MGKNIKQLQNAVEIQNNNNTRYLGGYKNNIGRTVLKSRLIRSGSPSGFSDEDIQILLNDYSLVKIIDFRTATEIETMPSKENIPGVEYIHLGLIDETDYNENIHKVNPLQHHNTRIQVFYALGGTAEAVIADLEKTYINLVTSTYSQNALRQFFEILLECEEGCIIFHCTGGKDRTGVAAALILSVLGIDWETCLADYMLTNEFWEDFIEQEMEGVRTETDDPDVLKGVRLFLTANIQFMNRMLEEIEYRYGSMQTYISDVLLLSDDKIAKLIKLYTE